MGSGLIVLFLIVNLFCLIFWMGASDGFYNQGASMKRTFIEDALPKIKVNEKDALAQLSKTLSEISESLKKLNQSATEFNNIKNQLTHLCENISDSSGKAE